MGKLIFKMVVFTILSFTVGFLDEFLRDKNIDFTHAIYFTMGWVGCLMF